ncbi:MAG TPA: FkbM family methyltransferase [Silvibacterium sp.]|nr:FkbM family methyltransferase [Silvibacterium sp.]
MKTLVKSLLPKTALRYLHKIRENWIANHAKESYSQEGEDMLLNWFLEHRDSGFYVDIGAHHPKRFSNTYRLYRRGWTGLNIDANPGSMKMFKRVRPRDINIEAGVSSMRQELTYYIFNEPALNTFRRDLALERAGGIYSIVKEIKIVTAPLRELLDQYVPAETTIDLLTIDVEGLDYDVLSSNDWSRYSPEFILVECLESLTLDQAKSDPVATLLLEHHYSMVAKTMHTALFMLILPDSR